jgi:chromate transporter
VVQPDKSAVVHRILVEEKRWVSEERFLHATNYCMLLPAPEAQQLATYIGWLMHRTLGGLPVVSCLASFASWRSVIFITWGRVPTVTALFFGLKASVLAS